MYRQEADDGKQPVLRIVPRDPAPRSWRVAWIEAFRRVHGEKGVA
jgi:hypothetical protein